jgi:hypothetical protein
VQRYYHAKAVLLASWQKGSEPTFYLLKRVSGEREKAWMAIRAIEAFGNVKTTATMLRRRST